MEDFITRHEHEEYVKRMEQEHKGMNARIKDLEAEVKEITDLTISINNRSEEHTSELQSR